MVVEDRFLELDFVTGEGDSRQVHRYVIGFDRRRGEYAVVAMDTYGTYFVTGRGKPDGGGRILMFGEDDDPVMEGMGLKKKFAFELKLGTQTRKR